jgi:hypothetical protein
MPAPAAPRPEPDRPGAEPEARPRRFRHQRPVEEEAGEVLRHGHGSGCIPVLLFRFSLLALLIWLVCMAAGVFLSRRASEPPHVAPAAATAGQR